jgi:hypothetical protein
LYSFAPSTSVQPFVHNVEVASHNLPFPDSHGAYIHNRSAMNLIYNLVFKQQTPPAKPLISNGKLRSRQVRVGVFYGLLLMVGLLPVFMLLPKGPGDVFLALSLTLLAVLLLVITVYGHRPRDRY